MTLKQPHLYSSVGEGLGDGLLKGSLHRNSVTVVAEQGDFPGTARLQLELIVSRAFAPRKNIPDWWIHCLQAL